MTSVRQLDQCTAEVHRRRHMSWNQPLQKRIERPGDIVERLVQSRLRSRASERLDVTGAEHVRRLERHREQRILGFSLHSRPHHASTLGAVGPFAGDVAEGQLRALREERIGGREGHVICQPVIVCLTHSSGGDAETEETGIRAGKLVADGFEVEKARMQNLAELRVSHQRAIAPDDEYVRYARVIEALEESA
jgi:hypothetical protein